MRIMKWKGVKWCLAFLVLALLEFFVLIAFPDSRIIFGFGIEVFMMPGFHVLVLAALLVLPYSLVTKRWHAVLGAGLGSLLFYPAVPVVGIALGILFGLPLLALEEGMFLRIAALSLAVFAFVVVRYRKGMKIQSQHAAANTMLVSGDKSRQGAGAWILLLIDLVLAICTYLELAFVVPVFGDMLRDFHADLPVPTQITLTISSAVAFHGLVFSVISCFILWMIVRVYVTLRRRGNRNTLFLYLWITLVLFIDLMAIMTFTLFLPIFRMRG